MNRAPRFGSRALLLAVLLAACSSPKKPIGVPVLPPPVVAPDSTTGRVELLWDDYGVPHIFARDASALFFASGFAQMRSHGDLILRLYGQARGRAAEYWGERYLESDMWTRLNGVPARSEQWWAEQPAHVRAYVEAFVAGMNTFAQRHPELIGAPWKAVLPVQPTDVIAHTQRVIQFTFMAGPRLATAARNFLQPPGSNGWAIAKSHSASGNALLLANPHLPWAEHFTFYEQHFSMPGLNAYGATLVGSPMPTIAFNDHLGWTHTVNTIDAVDLFDLETRDNGYVLDGQVRPFEVEQQQVRVLQSDGSVAERPLVIRRSVHGPIVAQREGRAIAIRVAGLDASQLFDQYWQMLRATNRTEFEGALARLQLPMFTVIYADKDGEIMHVFNGRVPVRTAGDWAYWQGIVNGTTSQTLWTETHPYHELPRVLNPGSGWVQNANDPPWTTTLPLALEATRFPAYMAPQRPLAFRPQRSLRMLSEDSKITLDELIEYKHSNRMEAADHMLTDVVAAARTGGDEDARQAAEVLERWDRTADADSRGSVLFAELYRMMLRERWPNGSMYEVPWTASLPLVTPDGLSDPRLATAILGQAARRVRALYGSLDISWGAVHRFRRDSVDLPANGGGSDLGIFRVIDFDPIPGDSTRQQAVGGDSFIAAVEFSSPVRARTLIGYGNASQPGSPHRTDQLPLMARKEMKVVRLTKAEVLQVVRLREIF